MTLIIIFWLLSGMVNVALVYGWHRRPFRVADGILFVIVGPIVLGSMCIFFWWGRSVLGDADGAKLSRQDWGGQLTVFPEHPTPQTTPSSKQEAA
jgi:hypothetical protein